ncbi:MAG TPA: RNHCP domain-containing protein [Bacilli bacterium]|nr:RNHCP domain-containing protein [Bacilli bacterium]
MMIVLFVMYAMLMFLSFYNSSRDHCNNCLCSKHVDINPGDRLSTCLGTLRPIGVEKTKKDMFKIIYKCDKLWRNKRKIFRQWMIIWTKIIRVSTNGGNL